MRYVYELPGPTYQYARYYDWIKDYVPNMKRKLVIGTEMSPNCTDNVKILTIIESDLMIMERKLDKLVQEWKQMRDNATESDFEDYQQASLIGKDADVVDHYPPQYIVGTPVDEPEVILAQEIENVIRVSMVKMTCQYAYSNPTNLYNLTITDRKLKSKLGTRLTSYAEWKKTQKKGTEKQDDDEEEGAVIQNDDDGDGDGYDNDK